MIRSLKPVVLLAGAALGAVACGAHADIIFDTGAPTGDFGFVGFDLSPNQSIAVAFTPDDDVFLDTIDVWMMNNNFDGITFPSFTLSLVTNVDDGGLGEPSSRVIEQWELRTSAVGFDPRPETATSDGNTILEAGTQYWLVGASNAPDFRNPVWVFGSGQAINAVDNSLAPGWNVLDGGATPSVTIRGTVVPTPAAAALLGFGVLASARRRR